MGLRYHEDLIVRLTQGVRGMEDSTFYRYIAAKGARKILLRLARRRFKELPEGAEAAVTAITDLARLEDMTDRALDAAIRDELLATPGAG
jgi:hypothetical protein